MSEKLVVSKGDSISVRRFAFTKEAKFNKKITETKNIIPFLLSVISDLK